MLKAFGDYLEAEDSLGLTQGDNLFVGHRPSDAQNNCSTILERTGAKVHPYVDAQREVHYQLLTRDKTYFTAQDKAVGIFEYLVNLAQIPLQNWTIQTIEGIAPQWIGMDKHNRHEFSANLTLRVRKES